MTRRSPGEIRAREAARRIEAADLWMAFRPGADRYRAAAGAFASNTLPIIRQIEASGVSGLRAIAAALNARGIRTARGGGWHATTVRNMLARPVSA
jgi:hypothetical protein